MERMICVVGPTASGKTGLAVALAKAYDGEVVSCDSMQLYRHMDIGTAKPTLAEMDGVRHHMIDVAEPDEPFSVGRYVELADRCVQDILSRGKTVIVAGGTGLYVDSLIAGRSFAPAASGEVRERLEQQLRQQGAQALLERLRQIDPTAAGRLHPADEKRIVRALAVYEQTGKTLTEHDAATRAQPPRYQPVWLGLDYLDRAVLYRRIDQRVEQMLQAGLLDEVRAILARGVSPQATALQAIGYKEFLDAMRTGGSMQAACALVQQRSRNYAKRQLTWFRRNPDIHWLRLTGEENFAAIFAAARQLIPFSARDSCYDMGIRS